LKIEGRNATARERADQASVRTRVSAFGLVSKIKGLKIQAFYP